MNVPLTDARMMKYWSYKLPDREVPADVGSNPTTPIYVNSAKF